MLDRFDARLGATEHAVYHVRRLTKRHPHNPTKPGITARSVRAVHRGTPEQARAALLSCPGQNTVAADGITRMVVRARGEQLPRLEEFYVAAPAVVEDKARNGFEAAWSQAVDAVPVPSRIPRSITDEVFNEIFAKLTRTGTGVGGVLRLHRRAGLGVAVGHSRWCGSRVATDHDGTQGNSGMAGVAGAAWR